jgi:hypothetical protein
LHDLVGAIAVEGEAAPGIDDLALGVLAPAEDQPADLGAFLFY